MCAGNRKRLSGIEVQSGLDLAQPSLHYWINSKITVSKFRLCEVRYQYVVFSAD